MALSPWPDETRPEEERTAAAEQLKSAVQGAALESDERANQLGAVASAMVEEYAPGAPQELKNEAVIRFAGYLAQSDFGTIRKEDIGPQSFEYVTNHAAMFRNSGAAALITRWKIRRAGAI